MATPPLIFLPLGMEGQRIRTMSAKPSTSPANSVPRTRSFQGFPMPNMSFVIGEHGFGHESEIADVAVPTRHRGRVYFDQEFVVLGSGFVHLLELENIWRSVLGVQNRFHKCSLWWYPLLTHFRRNRLVPPDFPQDRLHRETANVPMHVPRFRRGVPALSASSVRLRNQREVSRMRCGRWWRLMRRSGDSRGSVSGRITQALECDRRSR